jgi:hypothetical protein
MGPVDMSAFRLGEPIGVHGDVFRNYRHQDRYERLPRPTVIPALTGAAAAQAAVHLPISRGIVNSPAAMGLQGIVLGAALQNNDPAYQRGAADLLLAARAASLAESVATGIRDANIQLAQVSAHLRSTPVLKMFGAQSVANYRTTMSALRTSLIKSPARNLGALIAVGVARSLLTDPTEQ